MIYNNGHRFIERMPTITQQEIAECPEFFAMSMPEISDHPACTGALRRLLQFFPWSSRKSVVQVRPQDWRRGRPDVLGDGWHIDVNVRLADGVERMASSMHDWRLLICSWGDVCGTDFMEDQLELPDATPPYNYGEFFQHVHRVNPRPRFVTAQPGELWEYTSRDIHRVGIEDKPGSLRLMIVAFESDNVKASGMVFPSIAERTADHAKEFTK